MQEQNTSQTGCCLRNFREFSRLCIAGRGAALAFSLTHYTQPSVRATQVRLRSLVGPAAADVVWPATHSQH
eukprot:2885631-Pleurochrysis_carterae.AAC.1